MPPTPVPTQRKPRALLSATIGACIVGVGFLLFTRFSRPTPYSTPLSTPSPETVSPYRTTLSDQLGKPILVTQTFPDMPEGASTLLMRDGSGRVYMRVAVGENPASELKIIDNIAYSKVSAEEDTWFATEQPREISAADTLFQPLRNFATAFTEKEPQILETSSCGDETCVLFFVEEGQTSYRALFSQTDYRLVEVTMGNRAEEATRTHYTLSDEVKDVEKPFSLRTISSHGNP